MRSPSRCPETGDESAQSREGCGGDRSRGFHSRAAAKRAVETLEYARVRAEKVPWADTSRKSCSSARSHPVTASSRCPIATFRRVCAPPPLPSSTTMAGLLLRQARPAVLLALDADLLYCAGGSPST